MLRVLRVMCVAAAVCCLANTVGTAAILYETDFAADPGWVTGNGGTFEVVGGIFHGNQDNRSGSYAYVNVAALDPNRSWKLEFDGRVNSAFWSAGMTFGLLDTSLVHGQGIVGDQSVVDDGYATSISDFASAVTSYSPSWSFEEWYHWELAFDAENGVITARTTNRDNGVELAALQIAVAQPFPSDMTYLGVIRPANYNDAIVDYTLDNIVLSQSTVPEPSALVCWIGVGMTAGGGLWWRRRHRTASL